MTIRRILILAATLTALAGCSREPGTSDVPSPVPPAPRREIPVEGRVELQPLAGRPPLHAGATMFEEVTPDDSGVKFKPDFDPLLKDYASMQFHAGGGICTADFTGDGRCDFYVTSPAGGGALYENRGDWRFRNITEASGLKDPKHWGTGAQGVDVDGDGDNDLFVCGYGSANRLWINDGKGHFTDKAAVWGLAVKSASMTMAWADIDGDGRLDGYLAMSGQTRHVHNSPKDQLFHQENGRFVDISHSAGIGGPWITLSAIWWDYDDDGLPDCYAAGDDSSPDRLRRNLGGGKFSRALLPVISRTPGFGTGSDVADINNDGHMDLLTSNMAASSIDRDKRERQFSNALYINSGAGRVVESAVLPGLAGAVWSWSPRMEDYDNDGMVDVFITNGGLRDFTNPDLTREANAKHKNSPAGIEKFWREQPMRKEKSVAFRNAGGLKFEKCSARWGLDRHGVTFGAATADFDNDGALDLVVSSPGEPVSLYRNRCDGNALEVRLAGTASNSMGLGATVTATTPGGLTLTRYVTVTRGFLSASDALVHFGLGAETSVASLTVRWPSGCVQTLPDITANQLATITEGGPDRGEQSPDRRAPPQ